MLYVKDGKKIKNLLNKNAFYSRSTNKPQISATYKMMKFSPVGWAINPSTLEAAVTLRKQEGRVDKPGVGPFCRLQVKSLVWFTLLYQCIHDINNSTINKNVFNEI